MVQGFVNQKFIFQMHEVVGKVIRGGVKRLSDDVLCTENGGKEALVKII